jgi:hypothetical protein
MTDNRTRHRIDSLPLSLIYQHPFLSYRKRLFIHSFPYFITKIRREKFERKKRQFPKKLKARTLKKKPQPQHSTQEKNGHDILRFAAPSHLGVSHSTSVFSFRNHLCASTKKISSFLIFFSSQDF